MKRKGFVTRDSGFLARCLISKPTATQGKRFINETVIPGESLTVFRERLMGLARGSIEKSSEDERYCLHFSSGVWKVPIEHYNTLGQGLSPSGPLGPFRGYIPEKTEDTAGIAALFRYLNYGEGKVSADIMMPTVVISSWYTDEYKKLFTLPDESELQQKSAEELFDWLVEECRGECPPRVRKDYILQCGPGRFRDRKKLNALLNILESQFRPSVMLGRKAIYVPFPQIASLKLPDVSGISTSGYHYNKLEAK